MTVISNDPDHSATTWVMCGCTECECEFATSSGEMCSLCRDGFHLAPEDDP